MFTSEVKTTSDRSPVVALKEGECLSAVGSGNRTTLTSMAMVCILGRGEQDYHEHAANT